MSIQRARGAGKAGADRDGAETEAESRWAACVSAGALVAEYVARTERLAPLFPRLHTVRTRPLPADLLRDCRLAYETPQNLALELCKSILYEHADVGHPDVNAVKSLSSSDSLWNGKPQQYFESMNLNDKYDGDSIAP